MRQRPGMVIALLVALGAGCSKDAPAPRATSAALASERILSLGRDTSESPGDITYAAVGHTGIAIVDNASRQLYGYTTRGVLRWRVPFGGGVPGGVRRPNALSWFGDTLIVAEVDGSEGVWSVDDRGVVRNVARLAIETPITSVERVADGYLVATTEADGMFEVDSALVVRYFDRRGQELRKGCRTDPRYGASVKAHGMTSIFRSFAVVASSNEVFCKQPLSGDLVVMAHSLEETRRVALPGWRMGEDARMSMDLISINHFRASSVEWTGLWRAAAALTLAGATYDAAAGRDRFTVVKCLDDGRGACAAAPTDERVLGVLGDSVVTVVARRSVGVPLELRVSTFLGGGS